MDSRRVKCNENYDVEIFRSDSREWRIVVWELIPRDKVVYRWPQGGVQWFLGELGRSQWNHIRYRLCQYGLSPYLSDIKKAIHQLDDALTKRS